MGSRVEWALIIGLMVAVAGAGGCQQPKRKMITFPPGTLTVPYEFASAPSSCLVASVTMASNYLLEQHRFKEPALRTALKEAKLDETKVGDLKTYLASQGLELVTLAGRADGNPPAGLRFWVANKGYPAICVINQHGDNPQFNHAVVVTGFSANTSDPKADIVYYLDPAARDPLQSVGVAEFEKLWARGDHAMLIVVQRPAEQPSGATQPARGQAK